MRLLAPLLAVAIACPAFADECMLPNDQLIRIAKAEYAEACAPPRECRFTVIENERDFRCAVQISLVARDAAGLEESPLPGAYQLLLLSNDGAVVARVKGM